MKLLILHTFIIFISSLTFAQTQIPNCMARGKIMPIDNATVLKWKHTSANQFRSRGHILGTVVRVYPDHTGHHHNEVQIGSTANDYVEVIYNEEFGIVPQASPGAKFEACGDYITANKSIGRGPPSPDGALIHWVHRSNDVVAHDSGYIVVNGILCGQK